MVNDRIPYCLNGTELKRMLSNDPDKTSQKGHMNANNEDLNNDPDHLKIQEEDEQTQYELETRCGIGNFKPNWLQRLASKKSYVLAFGLVGMFYAAVGSYFSSTISTIEKRFKIPSKTSGFILATWDIGVLSCALLMAYLGSKGHKARWVGFGTLLVGVSCFMRLLPHLIYGPGEDALQLTVEFQEQHRVKQNYSLHSEKKSGDIVCRCAYHEDEDCSLENTNILPVIIFVTSQFVLGVGDSMYNTLGIAYLDDNVSKDKSPLLLAIWQLIRLVGPSLGFVYGSYALEQYVDISAHPTITNEDPRWIGAWWLGWTVFGFFAPIIASIMALFPKKLPRAAQRTMKELAAGVTVQKKVIKSFSDFKQVMFRLLKNKILVLNSLSSVLFSFGLVGFYSFMPKYMETQFRQTASDSSFITGSIGLICSALGIMASGIAICKFKPRPRYLAGWNVFVEFLDVLGHVLYGFLQCAVEDLHGAMKPDHSWELTADCNSNCDCGTSLKYSPVCSSDGSTTFYTACHAGCTTVQAINGTKMYSNCSCIGSDGMGWAVDGVCPVDCTTNFTIFLAIQCLLRFLSASGRAGNTILQFRCVDPEDKSVSIGFTEVLLCALSFVPGPIIYGILLDSACIVWGQTCGQRGNCWLYDGQTLGFIVNFTSSGFLLGGTILDIGVWYYSKDLQIYDKELDNTASVQDNKCCSASDSSVELNST